MGSIPDAEAAREQARAILSERRFQEPEVPRPFETPLDWLGDRVEAIGRWLTGRIDSVDGLLPGGGWVVWLLLAIAFVALGAVVARVLVRRRAAEGIGGAPGPGNIEGDDPALLERAAAEAERSGAFGEAVRLRFRAGVLRLNAEARTTGEIAAELHSPDFEALGSSHDAIAYGGAAADAEDAEAARTGWQAVLR